jgi:hypothetical protein
MGMRVFVVGGTGVIGWRLVPPLVARGHQVTAPAFLYQQDRLCSMPAPRIGVGFRQMLQLTAPFLPVLLLFCLVEPGGCFR